MGTAEANIENERFSFVCSRCHLNLKSAWNFMSLFDILRHRNVLKIVPLVQQDYSIIIQSDFCFLAFSLTLPSSLIKLLVGGALRDCFATREIRT